LTEEEDNAIGFNFCRVIVCGYRLLFRIALGREDPEQSAEGKKGVPMKKFSLEEIRNVGIVGGGRSGKTSLTEALVYFNGAVNKLGSVDEGTTVSDFDADEIERRNSHHASLASLETQRGKLNIVDTPGIASFLSDTIAACRVVDGVLVVVSAVDGMKFETETVWKHASDNDLPKVIVISGMDRERADFSKVLQEFDSILGVKPLPIQWPVGKESGFSGVVDLLQMKARIFPADGGGKDKIQDIPEELQDEIQVAREALVENVAESDDDLLEKYLEGETPEDEELRAALRKGILAGKIVPVVFTVAVKNWGSQALMDVVFDMLPSAADRPPATGMAGEEAVSREADPSGPLSGLVFKTVVDPYAGKISLFRVFSGKVHGDQIFNGSKAVKERFGQLAQVLGKNLKAVPEVSAGDFGAMTKLKETATGDSLCDEKESFILPEIDFPKPVISVAVAPKSKGDEDKLSTALSRLKDADAALRVSLDPQTQEMIIATMGQQHIEIVIGRLKKMGVEVVTKEPKVPYRETISKTFKSQYRHKKQTGGAGQFAEVFLRVEPMERGEGFEYGWEVFGGAISKGFQTSIEKGIRQVLNQGVIAGYPVVDVKAVVYDGKEHPVDSKDIAFQIAGREAFKMAVQGAGPKILEPIMALEIVVPEECVGDVMGDLNSRRGRVGGVDSAGGRQVVKALAPLAEILRYATDLTSMTGGRGQFTMELAHYEEVPAQVSEKIIAAAKQGDEEKKA
jgi:elongation factor G